ncbi:MAG: signal peptidase II [Parcubacteria group bacterium]|jgi:signal peptidase II
MEKIEKKYKLIFLIFFLAIIDQLAKYLIRYFDGFYICNGGISFGFSVPNWVFYPVVALIFIVACSYLWEKINFEDFVINKVGIAFILGGAIANLMDRYNFGCIIDFIDLKFFPVFNLADIFIMVGALLIIFKRSKNENN